MSAVEMLSHQVELLYDFGFEGALNSNVTQIPVPVPVPFCAGSIISPFLILTVFSCLAGRNESLIKIRANGRNEIDQIRSIDEVFSYAALDSEASPFDVAVIRLNSQLELDNLHTSKIRYSKHQVSAHEEFSGTTSVCQARGVGEVTPVGPSKCSAILKGEDEKNFICSEPVENVPGSFQLPLAGSSLIFSDELYGLLAVNSSSDGENQGKRVYTSVAQFSHWIRFAFDDDEIPSGNFGVSAASSGGSVVDQIKNPVPYQLSIRFRGTHDCGGVILDKKTALSAAHCFDNTNPNLYTIVTGEQNLRKNDGTEQIFQVAKVVKHPNWPKRPHKLNILKGNDIALIWIKGEFNFTDRVNNIWISSPTTETKSYRDLNLTATATGWGKMETYGQPTNVLQSVDLKFMDHSSCKRKWRFLIDSMICGYNNTANICGGDSGGPLVLKNYLDGPHTKSDLLVGIPSFGPTECEEQSAPNGFTNVAYFHQWIAENRPNSLCLPCQFQCFNGECIDKALKCNWKFDCADGSDEKVCSSPSRIKDLTSALCPKMKVDQTKNPVPYQLSLHFNGRHVCGAIILDKKTALSAAHCFGKSRKWSNYKLVAGEQNLNETDGTEQVLEIQRAFQHPNYKTVVGGNDIAVIQVKGEFNFTDRVNNIRISSPTTPNFQDVTGRVTGWGKLITHGEVSNVLNSLDLVFMDHAECTKEWTFLKESMICGYNNASNICGSDAGGPLVIKNYVDGPHTSQDLLVGISSFGPKECEAQNFLNGFTNVSQFYDWIAERRSNSLCSPAHFQCFNGECIDEKLKCDKNFDCEDGSDEKVCESRVTRNCGGLIKLAYSTEIMWRAPTSHPHPNSSCLWIIANPHADRPSKTQIKIINQFYYKFENVSSQLYVIQNLTGSQLSTFPLTEIDFEYNFDEPFLMLYFRTNSTSENSGIRLKITDKSESSDYIARNAQEVSWPAGLNQNTSQSQSESQSQSFSHVYSGSHCKRKMKSRQISPNAPLENSRQSQHQNPPFVVSIKLDDLHICSGVILDKKTVLSTASCFHLDPQQIQNKTFHLKSSLSRIRIVAGERNLRRADSTEQILEIQRLSVHEKWTFSNASQENDIALVHLKAEFTFNEHVTNIWISTPETLKLEGASGNVSAWIFTNGQSDNFLPDLKTIKMNLLENSECKKTHPFFKESMICGSGNSTNLCGITGAPFVLKDGNRDVLLGLSLVGPEVCESLKTPVVFTRVDYFYDWIEKNRGNSSCSASEFQCFNGECIRKELKCNYVFDCSDGSDESVCKSKSGSSTTIKHIDSCARRPGNQNSARDENNKEEDENLFIFLKPIEDGGRIQVHLDSLQTATAQDSLNIISFRQKSQEMTLLNRLHGVGNWSSKTFYGDENEPVLLYFHARPGNENQRMNLNYFEKV